VRFFTDMSREPTDVWAVRVDGLWLEDDPGASGGGGSNWMIATEPISPERLELVETDIRSRWHGRSPPACGEVLQTKRAVFSVLRRKPCDQRKEPKAPD
jgi:hypothetical protein